jgi:hypothetical protein
VTLNGLDTTAYALIGSIHREADDINTYTQDTDYNDRTKFGTTGGTANTNVSNIVGDRVATLAGDTYNPTALSVSADVVSMVVALKEVVPFRQTVTEVEVSGGKLFVRFGKDEREFGSLAEAQQFANFEPQEGRAILQRLAIKRYLAIDPTGINPSVMEGHSIAFTSEINRMVEVF